MDMSSQTFPRMTINFSFSRVSLLSNYMLVWHHSSHTRMESRLKNGIEEKTTNNRIICFRLHVFTPNEVIFRHMNVPITDMMTGASRLFKRQALALSIQCGKQSHLQSDAQCLLCLAKFFGWAQRRLFERNSISRINFLAFSVWFSSQSLFGSFNISIMWISGLNYEFFRNEKSKLNQALSNAGLLVTPIFFIFGVTAVYLNFNQSDVLIHALIGTFTSFNVS